MKISVIIPTLNEAENIGALLEHLYKNADEHILEVIVSDGGSIDNTKQIVQRYNAIFLLSPKQGRAGQMNFGAQQAQGNVLYFVHADTLPPVSYSKCICNSILQGFPSGCCSYSFNSTKKILRFNSYMTRFNTFMSGGGDQTLFITKEVFDKIGRFNEDYIIMEDFELIKRIKQKSRFKIIKSDALVSDRKYQSNSYFKVTFANTVAMIMFRLNYSPEKIKNYYSKKINLKTQLNSK